MVLNGWCEPSFKPDLHASQQFCTLEFTVCLSSAHVDWNLGQFYVASTLNWWCVRDLMIHKCSLGFEWEGFLCIPDAHTITFWVKKKDNGNSWICIYHFLLSGPFPPHMGMFYFLANGPNPSAQKFLNSYITNVRLVWIIYWRANLCSWIHFTSQYHLLISHLCIILLHKAITEMFLLWACKVSAISPNVQVTQFLSQPHVCMHC